MRKVSIVLAAVPLVFAACSSTPRARLAEWRNNELTICCNPGKKACGEKDWERAVVPYCNGNVKMVGGRVYDDVAGYSATPSDDKNRRFELQAQRVPMSCRVFECQGNVLAPAE